MALCPRWRTWRTSHSDDLSVKLTFRFLRCDVSAFRRVGSNDLQRLWTAGQDGPIFFRRISVRTFVTFDIERQISRSRSWCVITASSGKVWPSRHSKSLELIRIDRLSDFLLVINSKHGPISYFSQIKGDICQEPFVFNALTVGFHLEVYNGGWARKTTPWVKKTGHLILAITSANDDRFSKFINRQIQHWLRKALIIKDSTTP